jgi:hypothetical protein
MKKMDMYRTVEHGVFFNEDVISFETWRLKSVATTAHSLIDKKLGLNAFVWSGDEQGERFMIVLAIAPGKPTSLYEANLIDEDSNPQLKCLFLKG